jgi:hypothetical protein
MKNILAALVLAMTCACSAPQKRDPNVNLAGYPPAFRAGYLDGCEAARRQDSRKDEKRFKSDAQYAAGWRDGSDICARPAR